MPPLFPIRHSPVRHAVTALLLVLTLSGLALSGLARPGMAQSAGVAGAAVLPFPADPATRKISVKVTPGLTRTRDLPTDELRQARRDMLAGTAMSDALLRALADHRDGLAAQRYVRRLVADGVAAGSTTATLASDIAYFGSVAVASGRVWSLPEAVAAMQQLDPATEPPARVKAYVAMLYPHAWAGNTLALDALIQLNGKGRLFGPMSERTRGRIMEQARKAGDGRTFLHLALVLMQDGASDKAPDKARTALIRDYLTRAQAGSHLGVRTAATTLLARLDGGGAVAPAKVAAGSVAEADLIAAQVTRTLVLTAATGKAAGAAPGAAPEAGQ